MGKLKNRALVTPTAALTCIDAWKGWGLEVDDHRIDGHVHAINDTLGKAILPTRTVNTVEHMQGGVFIKVNIYVN